MAVNLARTLIDKIKAKTVKIGVIGLGYVGLPLSIAFSKAEFSVLGFDSDEDKVRRLNEGQSYIDYIDSQLIKGCLDHLEASNDFSLLANMDCILICVPTPLNKHRDPDLSYIIKAAETIQHYLQKGQLLVLESTTYPGTTEEVVQPVLESSGRRAGVDFFLAYSPEREDPNNKVFSMETIPKVVGGVSRDCQSVALALYGSVVSQTVAVSSPKVAEASKILENIYRSVNIALVNEMKILFDRMDIDIWEVIEAAKSKPFGFQAFYPGPGLGGHCVPIDPFYLSWKAREYNFLTRFIELSGEINAAMPDYVVAKTIDALNQNGVAIRDAKLLILGIAYKKDIDDMRESPSLKIIQVLMEKYGAKVDYNDPFIPVSPPSRTYSIGKESIPLSRESLQAYDAVLILTDHSSYDPEFIASHAKLIIDTRNLVKGSLRNRYAYKIYKA